MPSICHPGPQVATIYPLWTFFISLFDCTHVNRSSDTRSVLCFICVNCILLEQERKRQTDSDRLTDRQRDIQTDGDRQTEVLFG